jgi:uncharacterized protein YjiS (DUF1127 family)
MKSTDEDRGTVGVVCSLVNHADGTIRLILDDSNCVRTAFPQVWEVTHLFTWTDYDKERFMKGELTERELADIGLSLVARLAALVVANDATDSELR